MIVRQNTNGIERLKGEKGKETRHHQTKEAKHRVLLSSLCSAGTYHIPAWLTTNSKTTRWHVRLVALNISLKGLRSANGAKFMPNISECQRQRMKRLKRVRYSHLDRSRMAAACNLVCPCHPFNKTLPLSNTQIRPEWLGVCRRAPDT